MKLSYLITFSNETDSLKNLLEKIIHYKNNDQIVLLADSGNIGTETQKVLSDVLHKHPNHNCEYWEHNLNNNYSEHKNFGISKCSGDYIFQIDGDENPTETLLVNIKDIIESNPDTEVFWVSRINDFKGVADEHAKQWGWKLSMSPTYNRPVINWPDPQCRIFKNVPDRIKWIGRLHERIEGNNSYVYLPFDEELALYHDKTIEKQIETNLRYNKNFSEKENKGFSLPK